MEEVFFHNTVWSRLDPTGQALVRQQRGPMAGIPFHCSPVSTSRFDPQCFRVLLLRRLWCPLPLSSAFCRCGQLESGCPPTSASRILTFFLEFELMNAAWRSSRMVCRSSTEPSLLWTRTLVCTVRADGAPRRQCATTDGAVLAQARRRKELRYLELTGEHGRARLVAWHARLEGDGQMRRMTSSGSWRGRGPVLNHGRFVRLQDVPGSGGGAQRCPVVQHRPSRCPSWNAEGVWAPTVQCLAPLM